MASVEGFIFDTSEVDALSVNLGRVPLRVMPYVKSAVEVTARKVKDQARSNVTWSRGARLAPLVRTINYDIRITRFGIEGEVGYDRVGQGLFAHLIEEGNNGAGMYSNPNSPQHNLTRALASNIDDYETGIRKAFLDGLDW